MRLALSKGPNISGISLPWPEDGYRSSFRNIVFSTYLEFWTMDKVQKLSNSENFSLRRIIPYKFLSSPLCVNFSATNHKIISEFCEHFFLVSLTLQNSVQFSRTVAQTAINIHILHNHNLWLLLSHTPQCQGHVPCDNVVNFITHVTSCSS
jgi:hypothetical protein